jgi:hypothetical protein
MPSTSTYHFVTTCFSHVTDNGGERNKINYLESINCKSCYVVTLLRLLRVKKQGRDAK